MDPILADLIDRARRAVVTDADRREQRISFAYGNARIENRTITRDMVERAAQRLEGER